MDLELAKEMTATMRELKEALRDAYETAAAARNLAGALSVAMFEIAPNARDTVERVLLDTLQIDEPISKRATELALEIIGRPIA